MDNKIYLKIYTENNNKVLVFEGQGTEDIDNDHVRYFPTRWDDKTHRFGTVVCGKNAISITKEAKELFTKLVREAIHTGDDISCVNVSNCRKRVDEGFEDKPTDVYVSYLGDIIQKFNVEECIHDEEFFIGCGEGSPKTWLLDELVTQ